MIMAKNSNNNYVKIEDIKAKNNNEYQSDLSYITIPSGETYNFKDSQARSGLSKLRSDLSDKALLVTQTDYLSDGAETNEDILYFLFVNSADQTVLTESEYKTLSSKTALFYYIKEG